MFYIVIFTVKYYIKNEIRGSGKRKSWIAKYFARDFSRRQIMKPFFWGKFFVNTNVLYLIKSRIIKCLYNRDERDLDIPFSYE